MELPGEGSSGEGTQEFQPGGLLLCVLRGLGLCPPILWLHMGQEERKLRARVWGEDPTSRDKNLFTLEWTVVLKDTHVSPGPCVGANL